MKNSIYILLLILTGCTTEQAVISETNPVEVVYINDAKTFETLLNEVRTANNVQPLIPELNLTALAIQHASDMFITDSLSHAGFLDRATQSGAIYFGECVAYNYVTPQSEISAYQSSASHFQQLINPAYQWFGYGKTGRYQCIELAGYIKGNWKRISIINDKQNNISVRTLN